MSGFLLAFILIMTVTLVVIETVTVRFIYRDELIIRIDFLLVQLILYPSRNRKRQRKRKNLLTEIRRGFSKASATKKALEYLFSRSHVTVRELDIRRKDDDPARLALASQRAYTVITIIIAYLSLKTEALVASNPPQILSESENEPRLTLDVSLASTLLRIISSFVIFISNAYRYKRKRGRKIV